MKLTVVRHGQTTHNARRILMGQSHGQLNELGKLQAKAVGEALKKSQFDFIYCSDLKRCKDTLKEIAKYHEHIPVVFTAEIRERSMGHFEGQPREKMDKAFAAHKGAPGAFKGRGGESMNEFKARIRKFLVYIKKNHPKDRLLLVTHGGVIRAMTSILEKVSIQKLFKTVKYANTGITEYEITEKKVRLLKFNDASHL